MSAPRIAVTGITGTIGRALGDLLDADPRAGSVIGMGTRAFDPAERDWQKIEYQRVDVRDAGGVRAAIAGADVVIHLAFVLYGARQSEHELEAINVQGTRNVWDAAVAAGASRFVHASSAAASGVCPRAAVPLDEQTPTTGAGEHFYPDQKARCERILTEGAGAAGTPALYMLRPCGVAGPHAAGAAGHGLRSRPAIAELLRLAFGAGLRPALPAPPVPLQLLHEVDAAEAFLRAAFEDAPPGAYNVAPHEVIDGKTMLNTLGFPALPLPRSLRKRALEAAAAVPAPVPAWGWLQLIREPLLLDTRKIRRELGWDERHSSREALSSTRAAWSA